MNNKKMIRISLMVLLVACFLFAYPTVAHAASTTGSEVGSWFSTFLDGILKSLTQICEGIIDLFASLIQVAVDFVDWIIGLFS